MHIPGIHPGRIFPDINTFKLRDINKKATDMQGEIRRENARNRLACTEYDPAAGIFRKVAAFLREKNSVFRFWRQQDRKTL